MAEKKTKDKDESQPAEATTSSHAPATLPAPTAAPVTVARAARPETGTKRKRLSKGQRKHVRRLKQSGEAQVIGRR